MVLGDQYQKLFGDEELILKIFFFGKSSFQEVKFSRNFFFGKSTFRPEKSEISEAHLHFGFGLSKVDES